MKSLFKLLPILAIIFVTCPNIQGQVQDPQALYFVQITDTHLGKDFSRTEAIIKKINNLPYKIDFVVHTGDIFEYKYQKEVVGPGFELFKQLKMPLYFLAGNVDIDNPNYPLIKEKLGSPNYIKEHKGVLLCFVSYYHPGKNKQSKIIEWIDNNLARNKPKSVLLFHHEPFMPHFYKNKKNILKNWQTVLKKHPVKAIFAGHLHRDVLIWHENTPEFVAPCIMEFRGRQASFRLYQYKNGRVSYSTFYQ
jgi:3',5'-cyclic AMP phosphodiesterase CpdA